MPDIVLAWLGAGALLLALRLWWWNKDTKGAATAVLAVALLLTLFTCAKAEAAELRAGLGVTVGEKLVGRDPTGTVWVAQELPKRFDAAYLHISSAADQRDLTTVDALGVGYSHGAARVFAGYDRFGGPIATVEWRQPIYREVFFVTPMFLQRRGERLAQVVISVRFSTRR
jgi:hypothetical protein